MKCWVFNVLCREIGFYKLNLKQKNPIKTLKPLFNYFYAIFCPKIAIIINPIFPTILLWFSYDFLWSPMISYDYVLQPDSNGFLPTSWFINTVYGTTNTVSLWDHPRRMQGRESVWKSKENHRKSINIQHKRQWICRK